MVARPSRLRVPDPAYLTVLIEPFEKQPGRSSISAVANLLSARFPGIDWTLKKTDSGRPMDLNNRWQLSVSHTAGCLAIALSKPTCGIDLEVLRDRHRWRRLYDWITPPDIRLREPTPREFLRAWTTKEALLKWQGLGLEGGMHRQPVPEQDRFGWQRVDLKEHRLCVRHEWIHPGMSLALVCAQPLPVDWLVASQCVSSRSDSFVVRPFSGDHHRRASRRGML